MGGQGQGGSPYYYYFSIDHAGGTEEQAMNINDSENGWTLLGSFELRGDNAVIQLSNKTEERTVYADAVKLVKL
jgi:hypothetical protein